MLKTNSLLVALAGISVLATVPTTSCSHTPPKPDQVGDTIHLVTLSSVIAFYSDSTADSIPIWLSCSCRSTLNTLGRGGDTSAFSESSRTPDSAWIIPHYLRFAKVEEDMDARTTRKHLRAWYAFSAVDHFGQTDYDTIRVTFDANRSVHHSLACAPAFCRNYCKLPAIFTTRILQVCPFWPIKANFTFGISLYNPNFARACF